MDFIVGFLWINILFSILLLKKSHKKWAQFAGVAEYTDYISEEV